MEPNKIDHLGLTPQREEKYATKQSNVISSMNVQLKWKKNRKKPCTITRHLASKCDPTGYW